MSLWQQGGSGNVKVVVRVKPEDGPAAQGVMQVRGNGIKVLAPKPHSFEGFSWVAGTGSSQEDIMARVGAPMVESLRGGFNSTILAYGDSGSGKTHTMLGPPNSMGEAEEGLIPRVLGRLFGQLTEEFGPAAPDMSGGVSTSASFGASCAPSECGDAPGFDECASSCGGMEAAAGRVTWSAEMAFLQIYKEHEITNLLSSGYADASKNMCLAPLLDAGVKKLPRNVVQFLRTKQAMVAVATAEEAMARLQQGARLRRTSATVNNAESSRSHAVFVLQLAIRRPRPDGTWLEVNPRLVMMDLAGSESFESSSNKLETTSINTGLLYLGNVLRELADAGERGRGGGLVQFNNHNLTRFLEHSMDSVRGRGGKLALIVTVRPTPAERLPHSLFFAQKALSIKITAAKNEHLHARDMAKLVDKLQARVEELEREVQRWTDRHDDTVDASRRELLRQLDERVAAVEAGARAEVDVLRRRGDDAVRALEEGRAQAAAADVRLLEMRSLLAAARDGLAASAAARDEERAAEEEAAEALRGALARAETAAAAAGAAREDAECAAAEEAEGLRKELRRAQAQAAEAARGAEAAAEAHARELQAAREAAAAALAEAEAQRAEEAAAARRAAEATAEAHAQQMRAAAEAAAAELARAQARHEEEDTATRRAAGAIAEARAQEMQAVEEAAAAKVARAETRREEEAEAARRDAEAAAAAHGRALAEARAAAEARLQEQAARLEEEHALRLKAAEAATAAALDEARRLLAQLSDARAEAAAAEDRASCEGAAAAARMSDLQRALRSAERDKQERRQSLLRAKAVVQEVREDGSAQPPPSSEPSSATSAAASAPASARTRASLDGAAPLAPSGFGDGGGGGGGDHDNEDGDDGSTYGGDQEGRAASRSLCGSPLRGLSPHTWLQNTAASPASMRSQTPAEKARMLRHVISSMKWEAAGLMSERRQSSGELPGGDGGSSGASAFSGSDASGGAAPRSPGGGGGGGTAQHDSAVPRQLFGGGGAAAGAPPSTQQKRVLQPPQPRPSSRQQQQRGARARAAHSWPQAYVGEAEARQSKAAWDAAVIEDVVARRQHAARRRRREQQRRREGDPDSDGGASDAAGSGGDDDGGARGAPVKVTVDLLHGCLHRKQLGGEPWQRGKKKRHELVQDYLAWAAANPPRGGGGSDDDSSGGGSEPEEAWGRGGGGGGDTVAEVRIGGQREQQHGGGKQQQQAVPPPSPALALANMYASYSPPPTKLLAAAAGGDGGGAHHHSHHHDDGVCMRCVAREEASATGYRGVTLDDIFAQGSAQFCKGQLPALGRR
ncbi:MAG: hypothetical protein J3K34DRAFT_506797 [Monoraphidium minutum]|nr:MAG: hypothetical protein J3K34DRAFT_506797 [Monoraphidium minutum]